MLFSRLQGKHNAELSITANVFEGILTKQLTQKAASCQQPLENATLQSKLKEVPDYREEASDMSENLVKELKVTFYSLTTNSKRKSCKKSRRCIISNNLAVPYS